MDWELGIGYRGMHLSSYTTGLVEVICISLTQHTLSLKPERSERVIHK